MRSRPQFSEGSNGRPADSQVLLILSDPEPYSEALAEAGFRVEVRSDAHGALAALRQTDFQVVVGDVGVGSVDGGSLLKSIRSGSVDVPVIVVAGEPSVETAIEAVDQRAALYLVQPVEPQQLLKEVERVVQQGRIADMKKEALALLGSRDRDAQDSTKLAAMFDAALEEIWVVYQPIVRWSSCDIVGYEALVRSKEPTMPHPRSLFAAAERLGRARELCRKIRTLCVEPFVDDPSTGCLYVNLDVQELCDDTLLDPTAGLGVIADRVVLELSERTTLDQVEDARGRMARLREMGFRIAIDDLGTGYAGLSSFALLEPEVVKLDRLLIRDIHLTPTKRMLVASMIQLCSDMGLEVIAEGVECVEERDCLGAMGCDLLQGFLFGHPGPVLDSARWAPVA